MNIKNKIKIGDFLVSHKTIIMKSGNQSITEGKSYRIVEITSKDFTISDDSESDHTFTYTIYEEWFYPPLKINRLKKLKKLNNVQKRN